jgi:hypothetical protein
MKLDPGMHIVMHLVFFGKTGVTRTEAAAERAAPRARRSASGGGRGTGGAEVDVRAMAGGAELDARAMADGVRARPWSSAAGQEARGSLTGWHAEVEAQVHGEEGVGERESGLGVESDGYNLLHES